MTPLPCVISKKAYDDVENVWLYPLEKWSVEQANRYHQLILDEIDFICISPEPGKPAHHIRNAYRYAKVKSHLIFLGYLVEQ